MAYTRQNDRPNELQLRGKASSRRLDPQFQLSASSHPCVIEHGVPLPLPILTQVQLLTRITRRLTTRERATKGASPVGLFLLIAQNEVG